MYSYMKTILTTLLLTLFTSLSFGQGTLYYEGRFNVYKTENCDKLNSNRFKDTYRIEFKFKDSPATPLLRCKKRQEVDKVIRVLEEILELRKPSRKQEYLATVAGYKIWRTRWNTFISRGSIGYRLDPGKIYSVPSKDRTILTHPYYTNPKVVVIDKY